MRYILASGSPRRKELLSKVLDEYEIIPAEGEEVITKSNPEDVVKELSFQKASEIFHKIFTDKSESMVVIGADTIVSYNHKILGKPKDRQDAADMIKMLQGDTHQVYTGVTVFFAEDGKSGSFTFAEKTGVKFFPMTDEEIRDYVATGEPDDKAGAYGAQGRFSVYIEGIDGDYFNVVGLPTARLYHELKANGLL